MPLIIINKSTVPIGTGDWVADIIKKAQPHPIQFSVVSCPEFLREGSAIGDFMSPHRTVIGSLHRDAAEKVAQLHLALRAPIRNHGSAHSRDDQVRLECLPGHEDLLHE